METLFFLNAYQSSALIGLSIILCTLYIVNFYKNLLRSKRREAARVLLAEIRFAEKSLEELAHKLTNYVYGEYPSVLPHNGWNKSKSLFASDFDQDELDMMQTFYATCEDIEEFIQKDREVYWHNAESRAAVLQDKLAEAVMRSYHRGSIDHRVLRDYKRLVLDTVGHDEYVYRPKHATRILDSLVMRARRISDTSCYAKLKELAR